MEQISPANATNPQDAPYIATKQQSYHRRGTQRPLQLQCDAYGPARQQGDSFHHIQQRDTYKPPPVIEAYVTGPTVLQIIGNVYSNNQRLPPHRSLPPFPILLVRPNRL